MRVLLTCPPMIGLVEEFRPLFAEKGTELAVPHFVQTVPEDELVRLVPKFDGWIIGDDPATARVLEAGRKGRLRACVKWGVGTDNVDFEAAQRLGLPVTNTPGVFGAEVADIAMHYVTGLARETFSIDRGIRLAGAWPKPVGISLAGRTVALIGFGDIGRETARRLIAARMRVSVCDPAFSNPDGLDVSEANWPDVLREADFVVFTCPLTPETRHMFREELLGVVRPGLRLVNVGRGPVVSESALVRGLADGRIHSAALDVFEREPLSRDSPLRKFDRCIFGSHNASNTVDAVRRVSQRASEWLLRQLS